MSDSPLSPHDEIEVIEIEKMMPSTEVKKDLTTGNILKHIIFLALPTMATMTLQTSYDLVDMYWVGSLGPAAISAVTVFGFMFMAFVVFNQIIGVGSVSLISRYYGAKDYDNTKTVIAQTFIFKFFIGLLVTVLGLLFSKDFYRLFGSSEEVIILGSQYAEIFFIGVPILFSGFTLTTSFKGIGDMMKPFYIYLTSTLINIILDPLLILGIGPFPELGIRGAAIASVFAQSIVFILGLYIFFSGKTYIKMEPGYFFKIKPVWMWRIMKIGLPAAFGDLVRNGIHLGLGRIVNSFGTFVMAAFGISFRIMGFIFIPIEGVATAVTTLVGQNIGAGKPERAEDSVMKAIFLTTIITAIAGALLALFAKQVMSVFTRGDNNIIDEGILILRFFVITIVFISISINFFSAFWGSGDTVPPMIVSSIVNACMITFIIYTIVILKKEAYYIWLALSVSELIQAAIIYFIFKRGKWKIKGALSNVK
ncbi:MAG: MATE family efflux transporter [bacterium]|nr:MATE family efflux transporter [bacterium]